MTDDFVETLEMNCLQFYVNVINNKLFCYHSVSKYITKILMTQGFYYSSIFRHLSHKDNKE